jgi:hypothetical protein
MPLTSIKEKVRDYTTDKVKIFYLDLIRSDEYTIHIFFERIR